MRIPIHRGPHDGLDDLVAMPKTPALQGQAAQLFPPRFDQVQPAGICRQQQQLYFGPGQQGSLRLAREVGAQILGNQDPFLRRIRPQDLLQELHEASAVPSRAAQCGSQAGGRLEGAQHPHAAAPAIVRGKGRPARATQPHLPRVGLGTYGAEFVEADDPPRRDRLRVGLDDRPLFLAKAASTVTWNQLCWRFHTKPSALSHFQIVAGVTQSSWCSWRTCCNRASVHSAKGYPRLWGLVRAKAITIPRVVSSCRRGRPERAASAKPAKPWALNRWIHARTRAPDKPTCRAITGTVVPWAPAQMIWARSTTRWEAVREWAKRLSSSASCRVNARTLSAIAFPPMMHWREYT
jgi:hypothetical protein